jgi:hypothetical protein
MTGPSRCSKIGCVGAAAHDNSLCELHWQAFRESRLSECERCHQYDEISLASENRVQNAGLCGECRQEVDAPDPYHETPQRQCQYLYILTLDGGDYYLGQTDDLERGVKEHYYGKFPSTIGRNPQLVWSEQYIGSNAKLQERMDKLAKLYSENPSAMLYRLQARLPLGGIQWG